MVEIILPIANKLDEMLGLKANVKFLSVLTSFSKLKVTWTQLRTAGHGGMDFKPRVLD